MQLAASMAPPSYMVNGTIGPTLHIVAAATINANENGIATSAG